MSGTASDHTIGSMAYNPAGQITSQVKSNDAYAWSGHYNVARNYTVNGLNQQTQAGATALGYDGRGNLTASGSSTYGYNTLNQLTSGPGTTLSYDPAGRMTQVTGSSGTTRFAYAGGQMTGEYSTGGTLLRRYVPGPGVNEPVIWYEGAGTTDRRWLHADERGSVIAVSDGSGAMLAINRYDEYGIPASGNLGRFQYTGQAWVPELGLYYYMARFYSPTLGRFMQTDPIGYGDGLNWYNYVGGDPVNFTDPSGAFASDLSGFCTEEEWGQFWLYEDGTVKLDPRTVHTRRTCLPGGVGIIDFEDYGFDLSSLNPIITVTAVKSYLCPAPSVSGTGGMDAYRVFGGSVSGGGSINPANGQISLFFDNGLGVGFGGGARVQAGSSTGFGKPSNQDLPLFGGGVNFNAAAASPWGGASGSYQLIGSNAGDWGISGTKSTALVANANISGHGQVNLPPIYDLDCEKK